MDYTTQLFGPDAPGLTPMQMIARSIVVFSISIVYIRLAGLRNFGRKSTFDQLTIIITGILLARAITGTEPFFAVIISALVLMLLHRLAAWVSHRHPGMENIIKGAALPLIQNGVKVDKNLKKAHITESDLYETLRLISRSEELVKIKNAYLEPSGAISIIEVKENTPEIITGSSVPEKKEEMATLVSCMNDLMKEGYKLNCKVIKEGLQTGDTDHVYKPEEVRIVNYYRFEGESDPADSAILYAIETNDGKKGPLTDAYGPYADKYISKFIVEVEEIMKKSPPEEKKN